MPEGVLHLRVEDGDVGDVEDGGGAGEGEDDVLARVPAQVGPDVAAVVRHLPTALAAGHAVGGVAAPEAVAWK